MGWKREKLTANRHGRALRGGVEMSFVLIRVMEIQVYPFIQTQTIHKMGVADCVKIIL